MLFYKMKKFIEIVTLGLFTYSNIENAENKEKLVCIDLLRCKENYYNHLSQLQIYKEECIKKIKNITKLKKKLTILKIKLNLIRLR